MSVNQDLRAAHATSGTVLKESIVRLAAKHGFDACHFTLPKIDAPFGQHLDEWLAAGFHADLTWMAESERLARRKNPSCMLDGVKTVICVAMRYSPPAYALSDAEYASDKGVISAYAHGNDYHDVMKKRLKTLARDLDALLGKHDQRIYVDTAPVLEHALAESSGLGWQGKHSLTLNRKIGSWFLLGELFTTAEIDPDHSASQHCGSCRACIDICPTKAIVAPFVVDSNRCISYLTIEYRGYIPRELRSMMGNRVYGCDDCQMICPWNRHATAPKPDLLTPKRENILPGLVSLLQLDEVDFRNRFAKSPVKRSGRVVLQRNVCIAMGNTKDVRFAPMLVEALKHDSPLVRGHAAWALEQLNTKDCEEILAALEAARSSEADEQAREEIDLTIRNIRMKS
ncbi:MAG TPA: tRNA epoxyqueuosine(34) reductase QueG [Mariprofundaceae bacterium]|nr:tRNA epoxyqueuosine(34) reductase QueG [Mariprofundaceae bacterium]